MTHFVNRDLPRPCHLVTDNEQVTAKQSEHVATEVTSSTVSEDVPPAQTVLSFAPPSTDFVSGGQYHPALTAHICLSRALPTQKCQSERTRAPIPWNPSHAPKSNRKYKNRSTLSPELPQAMRSNIPGQRYSSYTLGSL